MGKTTDTLQVGGQHVISECFLVGTDSAKDRSDFVLARKAVIDYWDIPGMREWQSHIRIHRLLGATAAIDKIIDTWDVTCDRSSLILSDPKDPRSDTSPVPSVRFDHVLAVSLTERTVMGEDQHGTELSLLEELILCAKTPPIELVHGLLPIGK